MNEDETDFYLDALIDQRIIKTKDNRLCMNFNDEKINPEVNSKYKILI